MAKKLKAHDWAVQIVMVLSALAISGLFLAGTTLKAPILSYLPAVVHTVAGWSIAVFGVYVFGNKVYKHFK